jgi:hypothetical protein
VFDFVVLIFNLCGLILTEFKAESEVVLPRFATRARKAGIAASCSSRAGKKIIFP